MSAPRIDLKDLAIRESEQVEWKENVADIDDPWDRQFCAAATVHDLDRLALRDALQRMALYREETGVEPYLSDQLALSKAVPPLLVREPISRILRPRNFAQLLFGWQIQRFVPGATSSFSVFVGTDRSEALGRETELEGSLIWQLGVLIRLIDAQAVTLYDKEDLSHPSALREALVNAFVHRDYQLYDPLRVTAFLDRVEISSPGGLPLGVRLSDLREGDVGPHWRNQTLAWFFNRLELAETEGQGLRTIRQTMRDAGNPPPLFEATEVRVVCTLPAHPRALGG